MESFESSRYARGKIYGVVIGIVVDNKHPKGEYRVKVKFPWLMESSSTYTSGTPDDEDFESSWARIATLMAGPDRGSFWLPEVDDEVLVAFEHGDVNYPYVIGALWNGQDKTIHSNEAQDGKNCYRTIRSRSGHVFQFIDDEEGKDKILLQSKCDLAKVETNDPSGRGGLYLEIDHSNDNENIRLSDSDDKNYVLIDSKNKKITINTDEGDILIRAPKGKVRIEAKQIETESSDTTTLTSKAAYKVDGKATIDVIASSTQTIKGATVNIN